ncbi:MAG TPA: M56 family metallopeptidase [Terracidiphilus sp.]|jgi:beta-lactamase regulating signal transducer with metallopeptidase domain|nr:M56 family metallopeptidase [Terracidiphilus sp.]
MIPDAGLLVVEAAVRALAAALVLWAAMRVLRVENVPAQKAAWALVLAAALAMPLLMRAPLLPRWAAVRIPAPLWQGMAKTKAAAAVPMTAVAMTAVPTSAVPAALEAKAAQKANAAPYDNEIDDNKIDASKIDNRENDIDSFSMTASGDSAAPSAVPAAGAAAGIAAAGAAPAPSAGRGRFVAYAWLAYLCVTAGLLLRLLLGLASSLRLWMQSEPVEAAGALRMAAGIAVRASRRITSPVNIGSGIVLPADYAAWDEEKLRVVLAHERSHVRQHDFYLQLLAGLYATATWFSPLGWWLRRRLSELGEAISDRAGMEAAASPTAYAQVLLEFAALPRPTYTGVAMAHSSNLSERIERLLNDSSFRRAFSGSRRALLALVPAVLFAAAALVHVQAAQITSQMASQAAAQPAAVQMAAAAQPANQASSADQASSANQAAPAASQSAVSGQSHPDDAQVTDEAPEPPSAPPAPQAVPAPHPVPEPPDGDAPPAPAAVPPVPPMPSVNVMVPPIPPMPAIHIEVPQPPMPGEYGNRYRYAYRYTNGDPYVIVGDAGSRSRFSGDWDGERQADIDKARTQAHGHFLLFRHDDKSYFIDDAAIVAQVEAMQKPIEALGDQMRALGSQMRDQGRQQREMARKARAQQAAIPTPDLTAQMAELNAAVAALKNNQGGDKQGGTVTRQQLAEIQRRLSDVQRQLISSEVKVNVDWNRDFMSKWAASQGEFGRQMGQLGKQMGEMARENDQKMKGIIDQSLKDGSAKPVQ